ncbi:MAG TPA: hypothetical protein VGP57_17805 [Actinoplanes sp.]|jgi:hypothetical protein|nr:hypothetical protein [Actinoplanes sp.]
MTALSETVTETAGPTTGPEVDDRGAAVAVFAAWLAAAVVAVLIWLGTFSVAVPAGCVSECRSDRDWAIATAVVGGVPGFVLASAVGGIALSFAVGRGVRGWAAGSIGGVAGLSAVGTLLALLLLR